MDCRNYLGGTLERKVFGVDSRNCRGDMLERKASSVDWRIHLAMLQQSKRSQEAEDGESAPKRIRGSASGRRMETKFKADPVIRNHCCTWRNTSLKEPTSEETEPYSWRVPIPTEDLEPAPTMPLPVGPIVLWQSATVTKNNLMLI